MICLFKRTTIKCTVVALVLTFMVGCSKSNPVTPTVNDNDTSASSTSSSPVNSNLIVYKNSQYGFSLSLPASWKGYSIVTDKWDGRDTKSGKVTETGPIVTL